MSNEEKVLVSQKIKMLQDMREYFFWAGADADSPEEQDQYQSWVNLLDRQIDFYNSDYIKIVEPVFEYLYSEEI